jgi:hemerythrin-like domain-containing protein
MSLVSKAMQRQHQECDDQINRCEAALQKSDMAAAGRNFRLFNEYLESHFHLEEEKLFPAFEKATGMSNGPTAVMRSEHADIRHLRDQLAAALESQQKDGALGVLETLNVLIQQHNVKEENILYPMCEAQIPDLSSIPGMGSPCCGACSCG